MHGTFAYLALFLTCSFARSVGKPHQNTARTTVQYSQKQPPLTTPWTDDVGTNPWPEYPRPQMERTQWKNLNGIWQYQSASSLNDSQNAPFGQDLAQEVLIPSCLESGLSGIQGTNTLYSWFRTNFTVPSTWDGENVLLNFGAVDYEATVFINGQQAGFHRGGYFQFTVDITQFVNLSASNEMIVFVHDPTDSDGYVIPIGKQHLSPSHIFYTPCSGIWQSVWIETAPADYVTQLDLSADMHGQVNVTVHSSSGNSTAVNISVLDGGDVVGSASGMSDQPLLFNVSDPKLWSPDSPNLYNVSVAMGQDKIKSYTGFRTFSKGTVDGVVRPLVNGNFTFIFGTLDQGYWPDGLYTPPNREAMVYDLQFLKELGFNMVRKHIKVEPALWYRACDEMGLLVIQDMPSLRPLETEIDANGVTQTVLPDADQQNEFGRQLELLVNQLKSYPSIFTWVIYNEGWGQVTSYYPEFNLTSIVKQLDPTRLVDATSGWHDHGAGDFSDNHHYANPQCGTPFYSIDSTPYDSNRIGIQGEFGGLGHNVSIDHLWNNQEAINSINQTYEVDLDLDAWNYRSHLLLSELQDQVRLYACSAGVWTQTADVEGEVNGLMTYDRRVKRVDESQWKADIQGLYDAASNRTKSS
ncbi:hydrolase [Aspergillus sclerotioniger CBS 115572]|uniref:Hydrolase n=1 Tax=Aspergillus sclerotioniger CBS 115572 TaxID=1450535 RepID=A0A317WU95_9EURO|nr:hydrolase [Aspergillus sclerotioniger CBS 115572]PWY89655.1 hydrolase [Aspergillus sclerotioniger CBS 115572]